MRIDVKELELGPVTVQAEVPIKDLDFDPAEVKILGNVQVIAKAEKHGKEIRVQGTFDVEVELPCARCLESLRISLAPQFDQFYRPLDAHPRAGEIALEEQDTEISFFKGDAIEVVDVVREQIVLALPMKPVCREECRGLCPYCGRNRNVEACDCSALNFDPRLQPLLKIKDRIT